MVTNCNTFHYIIPNDGCYDLAQTYGITLSDFYSWNPAVGNDCSHLITDVYVCVGIIGAGSTSKTPTTTTQATSTSTSTGNGISTPTPHQPNMVANCKKFDETAAQNDYCCTIFLPHMCFHLNITDTVPDDIATRNGITVDQFETWNPVRIEWFKLEP